MGNLEENQNNKETQTKKYKIISHEKFIKALETFAETLINEEEEKADKKYLTRSDKIEKLKDTLDYSDDYIRKLISGEKFPSSNVLEIFIKEYKQKFQCNDLGDIGIGEVEEIDIDEKFSKRLKQSLAEYGVKQIDLAFKLNVSKSTISKWCSGKSTPTISQLKDIAQIFGVHYLYLLGEIETKDVSLSIINEQIGINDIAINTIKFYKQINKYGKISHEQIKNDYGFDYIDIVNYIVSDLELFDIFYLEAANVLMYHEPNSISKERFDNLLNSLELDLTDDEMQIRNGTTQIQTPYIKTMDIVSKAVLQKKIELMFDNFINDIMKKKDIHRNLF